MCKSARIIRVFSAACLAVLAFSSLSQAGQVTGPVDDFTTTDSSKDNLLTLASPTFTANLTTYETFTSQVHSILGVTTINGQSDFEYQDASSPDNIHGDIPLPYAMVGRMANSANGTVLYKFVTQSGYRTAAGGTISADMYFRHDPDSINGDNAWIGVADFTGVVPSLSQVANEARFNRVTMRQLYGGGGFGFETYTGAAAFLEIPAGLTEFYVAFSDLYALNDPEPTYSSARLAISSLTVSAVLESAPVTTPGDFDGDGDVDGRDFLVWQRGETTDPFSATELEQWQTAYNGGQLAALTTVPEPGSIMLTWLAVLFSVATRKRFGR